MKKLLTALLTVPAVFMMVSCSGGGGGNDNDNMNQNMNNNYNGNGNANQNMNANYNGNMNGNTNGNMNGGTGGGGDGTGGSVSYLFYGSSLYYIDPTVTPVSPQEITADPVNDTYLVLAVDSYDTATNNYSGLHKRYMLYISNGKIYKVNARVSSTAPTPVQISNATDVCEFWDTFDEPLSPDDSYAVVERGGTDGDCSTALDNTYSLIKVSMSSSDAPIDIGTKEILGEYSGQEADLIEGFLVQEGDKVKACDENLANCIDLKSGVGYAELLGRYDINNSMYLINIDDNLYTFNGKTKQLSASPVFTGYSGDSFIFDTGAMYYTESEINFSTGSKAVRLKKLTFDSWNVETLYEYSSLNPGVDIFNLTQTDNYVIFSINNIPSGYKWVAVYKADGTSTDIDMTGLPIGNAVKNKFFYTRALNTGVNYCYWQEGASSPNCSSNPGYFAGFAIAPDGVIKTDEGNLTGHVFVVEGCSFSPGKCTGGNLKVINPSDMSTVDLGTLPSDTVGAFVFGIGRYSLGSIELPAGTETQRDIIFVDIQAPALQRITNTPDKQESVFF